MRKKIDKIRTREGVIIGRRNLSESLSSDRLKSDAFCDRFKLSTRLYLIRKIDISQSIIIQSTYLKFYISFIIISPNLL